MSPRRLPLLAATMAVVALAMPAGAATEDAVTISAVDTSAAPDVTLTVTVDGAFAPDTLDADAFRLLVSGEPREARLTGLPSDPIHVQLVIDTSGSMRGAPLDAAKAAAGELIGRLPDSAVVGVTAFGDVPYEVVAPTEDHAAAGTAIAGLQARGETAMYDGVLLGASALDGDRRALVLLTDGRDTASASTLEQAAAALGQSRAIVYGVALATPETDVAAAKTLVDAAKGSLLDDVTPESLAAVYRAIAGELNHSYRLTFEATATGSTGIAVEVTAGRRTERAETRVSVPVAAAAEPAEEAKVDAAPEVETAPAPGLWAQDWIVLVVAFAFFGALLAAGLVMATRERLPSQLARRELRRAGRGNTLQTLTAHAMGAAERHLERSGRRRGLERSLEQAGMNVRAGEYLVLVVTAAVAAFAVGLLIAGLIVATVFVAAVVVGARIYVTYRRDRRQAKFADQLEETLPLMSGALRAGYGLMQALDAVAQESEAPTSEEFRRLIAETRLGRDLTDGLHAMAERVGSEDFLWVVQAIDIHRQVGGDLAEVLDNVYATIRDRNKTRRQIQALSGEGKLSAAILMALPILMFLFISTVNSEYLSELTGRPVGVAMLIGAGVFMVLGGLWMRRIIRLVF